MVACFNRAASREARACIAAMQGLLLQLDSRGYCCCIFPLSCWLHLLSCRWWHGQQR